MQIYIWQQFSSNHSARFTVVGEFETPEAAQKAAKEFNDILTKITKWYTDPKNEAALETLYETDQVPITPPELQFSKQYNVEWSEYGIDWFWTDEQSRRPVTFVDRLVFITSSDTWLGSNPADKLMERLGGQVRVAGSISPGEDSEFRMISVDLSCRTRDRKTAKAIFDEVNTYFQTRDQHTLAAFDTPWRDYNDARIVEFSSVSGEIRQEDTELHFEGLSFFHIGYGLPGLIAYLADKGCEDIEYELNEYDYLDTLRGIK